MQDSKVALVASRKRYEKPVLKAHGSIELITKGGEDGFLLDANFTIGTPLDQLTVS